MPSLILNCAIYIEVVHWKGKMLLKVSNLRPSPYSSPPLVTVVDTTTYTHFSMLGSDKVDKPSLTYLFRFSTISLPPGQLHFEG
jgi:hypothetical protein